jgi:mannosyltransferase OCH1-like enzyme
METETWMKLLDMSSKSQEYPNIISDSSRWTAVYWSDDSCRKLVDDQFPRFLLTYNSFQHNIQRVDSCRYLILSSYGGVYSDTDISIHASDASDFEHLIPNGVGLVESPFRYNEVWQNSLMTATAPGHIFWNITIDIMMERAYEYNVLSTTGPKMIGDAVERFRKRYGHESNKIHDVHTLPCELFQRLPLGEWGTTFLNVLGREVLARAVPMQGCGRYGDGRCEITRHAGRASWTNDAVIT